MSADKRVAREAVDSRRPGSGRVGFRSVGASVCVLSCCFVAAGCFDRASDQAQVQRLVAFEKSTPRTTGLYYSSRIRLVAGCLGNVHARNRAIALDLMRQRVLADAVAANRKALGQGRHLLDSLHPRATPFKVWVLEQRETAATLDAIAEPRLAPIDYCTTARKLVPLIHGTQIDQAAYRELGLTSRMRRSIQQFTGESLSDRAAESRREKVVAIDKAFRDWLEAGGYSRATIELLTPN